VEAVATLAAGLGDDELRSTVPGTPAWTVHDVLAHLAGGCSDAVTGRMDGAPKPEWSARHVAERAELPVAELINELRTHQDAIAGAIVDDPRPALVWDLAVHHADLLEALDLGEMPERLWRPVLDAVAPMTMAPMMKAPMMKGATTAPPDDVEPYELFRALFSRRSRSQMQAWRLPLSVQQLDELCIFGPRDDDQPVPV
jgi:Mycothiol maleylpyruvate isomerase N-terminal domain